MSSVFQGLLDLCVELLKAVQGQPSLVVNVDLEGRGHELFSESAHFRLHGRAVHLYLLLVRGRLE